MGGRGGGAGARAGGGAEAGAELSRTIPFSEFEAKVRIDPKAKQQIRDAWEVMDDEARQYVMNSGMTDILSMRYRLGAKEQAQGGAVFRGKGTRFGRGNIVYSEMEPTGEVRIRPIAGGMNPLRTAATMVHEAGHVGGKYTGPYSSFAKRGDPTESTPTDVQLRFLGRIVRESTKNGNTQRLVDSLFVANNAYNYRLESSSRRGQYGFSGGRISLEDRTKMFGDEKAGLVVGLGRRELQKATAAMYEKFGIKPE
jgi:hypothetical protein